MTTHILAIDQGTTSSRGIVFGARREVVAVAQREFPQIYPASGWVEHDPEAIWTSVVETAREAIARAGLTASDIAAIGITNQRETTLVWDRTTGEPVHNAIVWQDRRTTPLCDELKGRGLEPLFAERTGLLLDPYFSGTKLSWLLENVEGVRERAERGELCFGTVDSYLIWRLTGGRVHATDATNASRTLMFNIATQDWDDELLEILNVPRALLPEVKDCAAEFGMTEPAILGAAIPILGVAGDQQAALIGQACFAPGMMKATYGTGCFALLNTGTERVQSRHRLLTTVAYRLDGQMTYALEGAIFVAGAAVQWLRDGLNVISAADETGPLAEGADPSQQVYLVPAFVGLGAPWWNAEARGAVFGLTRNSGPAELARAALESVAFQTSDLMGAMMQDWPAKGQVALRVDGGMARSDWAMQRVADIIDGPVSRPQIVETTALGAAWLAGSKVGLYPAAGAFAGDWMAERDFSPALDPQSRAHLVAGWRRAVAATIAFARK